MTAGWAAAQDGEARPGLEQAERGLSTYQGFGCQLSQTLQLAITAELLAGADDVEGGLTQIDQALAVGADTREQFWLSELHRLRGVILLQQDPEAFEAAEREYRAALEIAKAQGARLPRVRATLALARLAEVSGRDLDATPLLADALAGLDATSTNPDLAEARSRLPAAGESAHA